VYVEGSGILLVIHNAIEGEKRSKLSGRLVHRISFFLNKMKKVKFVIESNQRNSSCILVLGMKSMQAGK